MQLKIQENGACVKRILKNNFMLGILIFLVLKKSKV